MQQRSKLACEHVPLCDHNQGSVSTQLFQLDSDAEQPRIGCKLSKAPQAACVQPLLVHNQYKHIAAFHRARGGNLRIILRELRSVVTTIVFNPLLINPDNPRIKLGGVWAMVTTIAFNPLLINPDNS
jgi:hypothetical protein